MPRKWHARFWSGGKWGDSLADHTQGWAQGAMQGVSLAVVGLLLTVVWTILRQPGVDWRGLLIALSAFGLALSRKVNILLILALAGLVGFFVYR